MRALIYLRVSTHHQSTDGQKNDLLKFSAARGWQVTTIIEDKCSGASQNRPGLTELLRLARHRKIDCVVVWKMCRLFRSMKHMISILDEFQSIGVAFVSLNDALDFTTPSGKLLTQLLASFAEFELNLIRERVQMGIRRARESGKKLGRPSKVRTEEVIQLRSEGLSLTEIGRRLSLSKSGVSKILKKSRLSTDEKSIT